MKIAICLLILAVPVIGRCENIDLEKTISELNKMPKPAFTNGNNEIFVKTVKSFDQSISLYDAFQQACEEAKAYAISYKGGKPDRMFFLNNMFESMRTYEYCQSSLTVRNEGMLTGFTALTNWISTNLKDSTITITLYSVSKYEPITGLEDSRFHIFFTVNCKTNSLKTKGMRPAINSFFNGESLELKLYLEETGYIYIYNIEENGKCGLIFPNRYQPDNCIEPGTNISFPTEIEKKTGIKYSLTLPPKTDEIPGIIRIIAVKTAFDTGQIGHFDDFAKLFIKYRRKDLEYMDLGYWIVSTAN